VNNGWKDVAARLGRLAVREAPRLFRQIRQSGAATPTRTPQSSRRPGPRTTPATAAARHLVYAPQPDGRADPGEIVWTWVAYEDDPARGKDRPVLVVGRESERTLLALMLSSQHDRDGQPNWYGLGPGAWDRESRPSWIRLDRVLQVAEDGVRREGAVLDRSRFEAVAKQLRSGYGWT